MKNFNQPQSRMSTLNTSNRLDTSLSESNASSSEQTSTQQQPRRSLCEPGKTLFFVDIPPSPSLKGGLSTEEIDEYFRRMKAVGHPVSHKIRRPMEKIRKIAEEAKARSLQSSEPVANKMEDSGAIQVKASQTEQPEAQTKESNNIFKLTEHLNTKTMDNQNLNQNESRQQATVNRYGILTMNEVCDKAEKQPELCTLFKGLWYEGELCILYADTNVGKTILSMQMADHIARSGKRVLYVDKEMSQRGILNRSVDQDKTRHIFPNTLFRLGDEDMSRLLGEADTSGQGGYKDELNIIEEAALQTGSTVLIIDNITALCSGSEIGETASDFIKALLEMRTENNWSILLIAHTPKLDRTQPLTTDSMGGSKRIISLADSAFVIGEVCGQPNKRYIKQTKVRNAEKRYHENNVMICRIERIDGLLCFVEEGHGCELDLLQRQRKGISQITDEQGQQIINLRKQGLSLRKIAEITGVKKTTVDNYLKQNSDRLITGNGFNDNNPNHTTE